MMRDGPAEPGWKPEDARLLPGRAPQRVWDRLNTGHPLATSLNGFVYLDRVGPGMFVGRCDHGTCGAVPADAAEHAKHAEMPALDVHAVKNRNHAYMVTITPDGAEGICIYCGTTMEGCPEADQTDMPWDEPWDRPRRATKREMEAAGVRPIPEHRLLYLDEVDGGTWTGRFRVGECPAGGPHEAVLNWWRHSKDPMFSCCAFCGEQWTGAPPGFWGVVQPPIKAEDILARHAEDVRRGVH